MLILEFDGRKRFQMDILGRAMAHMMRPCMAKFTGIMISLRFFPTKRPSGSWRRLLLINYFFD